MGFRALMALSIGSAFAAQAPGAAGSISQAGAQYALDAAIPMVEQHFGTISIPDQSGNQDSFDWSLTDLTCVGLTIASGTITTNPTSGIGATISGVGIGCSGNWKAKETVWPHPSFSGSFKVTMSGTTGGLALLIVAPNGFPVATANDIVITVGSIDISFSGDKILDWLLDLFKGKIEGAVSDAISKALPAIINEFVTQEMNPALAKIQYDVPLPFDAPYNISEIRFGLTSNPTFTSTYVGVDIQGDIVSQSNPVTPPITPPALPPFDAAAANYYIQILLSSYTFETGLYTFYEAGLLDWEINEKDIPLGLNNTDAYTLIAPQLPKLYPNDLVGIELSISTLPNFNITTSQISLGILVDLAFNVTANSSAPSTRAFVLAAQTLLSLNLTIGKNTQGSLALLGDLSYLGANLSCPVSNVGPVEVSLLQAAVDLMFSGVVVPLVNKVLLNGIPLPQTGLITLTNTALLLQDGFVTLGSDFTVNPQADARPRWNWDGALGTLVAA